MHGRGGFVIDQGGFGRLPAAAGGDGFIAFKDGIADAGYDDVAGGVARRYADLRARIGIVIGNGVIDAFGGAAGKGDSEALLGGCDAALG